MDFIRIQVYGSLVMVFLVLAYISSLSGIPGFSIALLFQPFSGDMALISMILSCVAIFDLVYYHSSLLPLCLKDLQKNLLLALVFPETIAIMGFAIGILNRNLYAAVPFFLIALANMLYCEMKIRGNFPK